MNTFPKGYSRDRRFSVGVSRMLPAEVRQRLQAASEAPEGSRIKAIDEVVAWARKKYPQFFKEEEPCPKTK